MATAKHGLGRGLGALIKDGTPIPSTAQPVDTRASILRVPVDRIRKNPWQPRRDFEKEALAELAQSIRQHGILSPMLVRSVGQGYEIIAGERRFRAALEVGLKEVPVTVMTVGDSDAVQITLVENLQRADLNPLEEAEGYHILGTKFNMTQEQIAERVGKARASVANSLRLLELPTEVKQLLTTSEISTGHAKALLGLDMAEERLLYARRIVQENLSVRQLEKLIQKAARAPRKPRASREDMPSSHVAYLSDKLHRHFGTSVRLLASRTLANGKKARGSIEIDFYSNEDLTRILELMGITEE